MYLFVEVIFYSDKRKYLPEKGYHPDAVFNENSDYWGITFVELQIEKFDAPAPAVIIFTFQEYHYQEVKEGQSFKIMEGPHQVGEGKIISIEAGSY